MTAIGKAILVLIFAGTIFMAGFLVYNFSVVYNPIHAYQPEMIVSSTTSTSTTSTTTTTTSSLPAGAMMLPYNPSNKTVFLYLDSSSSGNPLNYNGTGNDAIHVYIPAGWTLIVIYTNYASLNHDVVILQNTTATPNSSDIGNDGKILAVAGGTPTNYEAGISTGSTASTSVTTPYVIITS